MMQLLFMLWQSIARLRVLTALLQCLPLDYVKAIFRKDVMYKGVRRALALADPIVRIAHHDPGEIRAHGH